MQRIKCPYLLYVQQEAQLPLGNRASAMHFFVARLVSFSIALITETYVRHIRNLRPMNRLMYYTQRTKES